MLHAAGYYRLRAVKSHENGVCKYGQRQGDFQSQPRTPDNPREHRSPVHAARTICPPTRAFYVIPHGDGFAPSREDLTAIAELTTHFVLTAKQPYLEDEGHIIFMYPESVDPKRGALFIPKLSGQVKLHLYVKGGHRYFVDFVVNSWDKGVYRVTAESGEYSEEDPHGTFSHVLAILIAAGSGWTQVDLKQDSGTGFELHRVEVTSVETASLEQ